MDDMITDDALYMIMKEMDISQVVKMERVSRRWQVTSRGVMRTLKSIGNSYSNHCGDRRHRVGWKQTIKSKYLFNQQLDLNVFGDMLSRCTTLESITIIVPYTNNLLPFKIGRQTRDGITSTGSYGIATT